MTVDDFLTMLETRAPALRTAGVLELAIGDLRVVLAPQAPQIAEAPVARVAVDDEPASAADDPLTYGLPPGAKVPGFERPDLERRQEDE